MNLLFRTVSVACVSLAASAAWVAPAGAQPTQVSIPADRDWAHQWTPMTFPARIDGFEREAVTAYEERETNISARYFDTRTQTILSLYIYRPGNPSTAIWFDRALGAVGAGGSLGTIDREDQKISRFVPSGGSAPSGLSAVLKVEGGQYRSTGVALYRAGEWLVKVRITSGEQSVSQLDVSLREVLADLPALDGIGSDAAQFVTVCERPLAFGETAPVEPTMTDALAMAFMADLTGALARGETDKVQVDAQSSVRTCREGDWNAQYNIYRTDGDASRYSLVMGDSGASIEVFPLLGLSQAEDRPTHAVSSATGLETKFHTPFRGLPNIGPASQSAFRGPVYVRVSRKLSEDESPRITIASGLESETDD